MDDAIPGSLLADRYRLEYRLGSGGTATVWAAEDLLLGRRVAVKLLAAAGDPAGRERLRREARALATLTHQHIVTVFDLLELPGPGGTVRPVLVTELLDGVGLDERLTAGPLAVDAALEVCAALAEALAVAHRAGIVHRDIKPGNVMLTSTGAKLLDFGIARGLEDPSLTGHLVIGTPACMAPEQILGREAVPASDVYALGCVLYWCLTGQAPYPHAELTALAHAHLSAAPPPLPGPAGLPGGIDELYQACLAKDSNARPTAETVAHVLRSAPGPAEYGSSAAGPAVPDHHATQVLAAAPADPDANRTRVFTPHSAPSGRAPRSRLLPIAAIATGVVLVGLLAWALSGNGGTPQATSGTGATAGASTSAGTAQITISPNSGSASPSTSATATLPNAASDPAGYLTALINQLGAQAAASTGTQANAEKDLANSLTDLQQSVTSAQQSGGKHRWADVRNKISDLEQHIADQVDGGRLPASTGDTLTTELQQLAANLPASSGG
jgi:serine/threonine-protein kinase